MALTVGSLATAAGGAVVVVEVVGSMSRAIASSADVGSFGAGRCAGSLGGHFTGVFFLAGAAVGHGLDSGGSCWCYAARCSVLPPCLPCWKLHPREVQELETRP